jgi:hypothetical protein
MRDSFLPPAKFQVTENGPVSAPLLPIFVVQQSHPQTSSSSSSLLAPNSFQLSDIKDPMELDQVPDRIDDIDTPDLDDPQFCADYAPDIFAYLKRKEVRESRRS